MSLHALQILLLDQNIYALLNHGHLGLEPRRQLVEDLRDKIGVIESFPHLHNAHDRRLDQQLAVLLDVLMHCLLLYLELSLQRLVNVDATLFVLVVEEQLHRRFGCQRVLIVVGG